VSSISSASWKLFQAIGIAERLEGKGCPIERIWVSDGLAARHAGLRATARRRHADGHHVREPRDAAWHLRDCSAQAAEQLSLFQPDKHGGVWSATWMGCGSHWRAGNKLAGSLLVAAEGRASPTREAARDSRSRQWRYDHVAIVTAFHHEIDHAGTAYEIFYPGGPFALLPMHALAR
jgi:2-octaprenyl-6-methoxyphenol hydroxylase